MCVKYGKHYCKYCWCGLSWGEPYSPENKIMWQYRNGCYCCSRCWHLEFHFFKICSERNSKWLSNTIASSVNEVAGRPGQCLKVRNHKEAADAALFFAVEGKVEGAPRQTAGGVAGTRATITHTGCRLGRGHTEPCARAAPANPPQQWVGHQVIFLGYFFLHLSQQAGLRGLVSSFSVITLMRNMCARQFVWACWHRVNASGKVGEQERKAACDRHCDSNNISHLDCLLSRWRLGVCADSLWQQTPLALWIKHKSQKLRPHKVIDYFKWRLEAGFEVKVLWSL